MFGYFKLPLDENVIEKQDSRYQEIDHNFGEKLNWIGKKKQMDKKSKKKLKLLTSINKK